MEKEPTCGWRIAQDGAVEFDWLTIELKLARAETVLKIISQGVEKSSWATVKAALDTWFQDIDNKSFEENMIDAGKRALNKMPPITDD